MNPLFWKIGGPLLLAALFIGWHGGQVRELRAEVDAAKDAQELAEDQLDEFSRADVAAKALALSETAAALQASQDEFERQLRHERELRTVAERQAEAQSRRAANADKRIEELKENDAEIREWGNTPIPTDWVDFMHGVVADGGGDLPGVGDDHRAGDQVAATAIRAQRAVTDPESG